MLENALGEYNDNINELEPLWEFPELLEVYINRDCVQYMMEYCTSVLEDPESASGVIDILETQWYDMDAGTYVQVHVMMESSLLDEDKDCSAEYDLAALRLDGLRPDFHHYDRRNIVRTCKNACKNFINSGYPKDMEPYVRKALSLVIWYGDPWSENRAMEVLALRSEDLKDMGETADAVKAYARSIDVSMGFLDRGILEELIIRV